MSLPLYNNAIVSHTEASNNIGFVLTVNLLIILNMNMLLILKEVCEVFDEGRQVLQKNRVNWDS